MGSGTLDNNQDQAKQPTNMTTFEATVKINSILEGEFVKTITGFTGDAVDALAVRYGFDAKEAKEFLGLSAAVLSRAPPAAPAQKQGLVKRMTPAKPLPFCGQIIADSCQAVRLNHGLYTQCTMPKMAGGGCFCKTCQKQVDTKGAPAYGTIKERSAGGAEWRDPKGKAPVTYAKVMQKLGIERAGAEAEAERLGWTIPESEFEIKEKRGRPKKTKARAEVVVSDSDGDEAKAAATPKGSKTPKDSKAPGAPKKKAKASKKVVATAEVSDDLIAALVKQAEEKQGEPSPGDKNIEMEMAEEPELEVVKFHSEGTDYLKAEDGTLFDVESHEPVGTWDAKECNVVALE